MPVPEWGGYLRIRSLTSLEHGRYEMAMLHEDGELDFELKVYYQSRLVAACLVDDEGDREYANDDYELIAEWDAGIVTRVYEAAIKHSGIERGDLEDDAKNSGATTGDDSQSD